MTGAEGITWVGVMVVGAGVGFLAGLFGKGGSALATPLLHAIGIPAVIAVTAPLPATIPSTMFAASAYRSAGLLDRGLVRRSVIAGVPATILGAVASRWVSGQTLVVVTDVLVILLGFRLVVARRQEPLVVEARGGSWCVTAVAVLVGALSGLLANSGGFLLVPLYITVLRRPLKVAFAASLVVSATLAVPGTIVHAALGHISWSVVGVFGVMSIPFARLGAAVSLRSNPAALERVYGLGLVVIGLAVVALR